MSPKYAKNIYSLVNLLLVFIVCLFNDLSGAQELLLNSSLSKSNEPLRLTKRNYFGRRCLNHDECLSEARGSVCMRHTCVCPQGYLPADQGCFQVGGGQLGHSCNASDSQCGEELVCRNYICDCPEGFQFLSTQGTNLCLLWHRPTRLVDRCRSNEDCTHSDANSVCRKRWCQCAAGYQLFETALFGRRHRCFKTSAFQCVNFGQCSKLAATLDQHCTCLYGYCHCISNGNFTSFDFVPSDNPNWYQRWKKDIVLATRLLFVTVILFFVPCFIYVTLGIRDRHRHFFSQLVQPPPPPPAIYQRRRSSHRVEVLPLADRPTRCSVENRPSRSNNRPPKDPPPSYDEIMVEEPPPPYRAL